MDITVCRVVKDGEEWWMEKSEFIKLGRRKREIIPDARQIARQEKPSVLQVMTTDGRIEIKHTYPDSLVQDLSVDRLIRDIENKRTRK